MRTSSNPNFLRAAMTCLPVMLGRRLTRRPEPAAHPRTASALPAHPRPPGTTRWPPGRARAVRRGIRRSHVQWRVIEEGRSSHVKVEPRDLPETNPPFPPTYKGRSALRSLPWCADQACAHALRVRIAQLVCSGPGGRSTRRPHADRQTGGPSQARATRVCEKSRLN